MLSKEELLKYKFELEVAGRGLDIIDAKNAFHRKYIDGTISDSPFEENRFFPVQCANWNGSERW